jgi:hypothetical protein
LSYGRKWAWLNLRLRLNFGLLLFLVLYYLEWRNLHGPWLLLYRLHWLLLVNLAVLLVKLSFPLFHWSLALALLRGLENCWIDWLDYRLNLDACFSLFFFFSIEL